jgi:citrate/tricarballylate utilization protein
VPPPSSVPEGQKLMTICNACRYCEGYCDVFPAMERHLQFSEANIQYLANLCHNCAECYYACQYAPPHEFAVNVPKVFAQVRAETYRKYAWPAALRIHSGVAVSIGLAAVVLLAGDRSGQLANFYSVIDHRTMVAVFSAAAAVVAVVHIMGFLHFWRETGSGDATFASVFQTVRDVLALKNLSSHGAGCTYPDEKHSQARRYFHHCTFYGFALCFASTTVAALYHFAGHVAPHPYFSAPVVLGTAGGIGLLLGPVGLYALKRRRDPAIVDPLQDGSDVGFLALLFLTSLTGLSLLVWRATPAMGVLLRVHLGVVLGLFLTLPYGKFVHGLYRSAALLRSALETARSQQQRRGQAH